MTLSYDDLNTTQETRSSLYRRIMSRFPGGISIILSGRAENPFGMTINSLVSASLDPLLLLFCARIESKTAKVIFESGLFSASILSQDQRPVARYFSGQDRSSPDFSIESDGKHIWIDQSVGSLLCSVEGAHRAGDHDIIIGRVSGIIDNTEQPLPLLYHAGRYCFLGPACTARDNNTLQTSALCSPSRQ